jgi:predicted RNA-binding protein with RPS1 domain
MAWRRVRHPSEVLAVGQEVTAKVLKFDQEKNRVSLGVKQLGDDPWVGISRRYPTGTRMFGKVTNITDYGSFVEIEPGIEGLVHVSEMDWTNKNVNPSKVVQLGDDVEVMVLDVDAERRRGLSAAATAAAAAAAGGGSEKALGKGSTRFACDACAVQQCLGWHAAYVEAVAAREVLGDHARARTAPRRLLGRDETAGARADDEHIEGFTRQRGEEALLAYCVIAESISIPV